MFSYIIKGSGRTAAWKFLDWPFLVILGLEAMSWYAKCFQINTLAPYVH